MNLEELIQQYRRAAHDMIEPYFVEDDRLTDLFNEAVEEAAIRGRLIHESQNPIVCQISVTPGQSVYPLHGSLYEITHCRFKPDGSSSSVGISLVSTEELDRTSRDWREDKGLPACAVQGDTDIRLVPMPDETGTLHLEGYRLPLTHMVDPADEPEINPIHHRHLYHWVLQQVFSTPDAEIFDPTRAAAAKMMFDQYFGLQPDSDLRRIVREDEPHHVQPFFV